MLTLTIDVSMGGNLPQVVSPVAVLPGGAAASLGKGVLEPYE